MASPSTTTEDPCLRLLRNIQEDDDNDEEPRAELIFHEEGSLEFALAEAEQWLMEKQDYARAAAASATILNDLPTLATMTEAALLRANALYTGILHAMTLHGTLPHTADLMAVWNALQVVLRLTPDHAVAQDLIQKITFFGRRLPPPAPTTRGLAKADLDVLVVGAGPAGIGTAVMLVETFGLDRSRVALIERGERVGETFYQWPAEMRFISPSFNTQGWTKACDLNAILYNTSPAYALHSEHPTGPEYARYLDAVTKNVRLNVRLRTEVHSIRPVGTSKHPLFAVDVAATQGLDRETVTARYVIWAAGEFQYPSASPSASTDNPPHGIDTSNHEEKKQGVTEEEETEASFPHTVDLIPGSDLCVHNSQVSSWSKVEGNDFVIIGGYESGCDAAYNLALQGKRCTVLASSACWSEKNADPSIELAPFTAMRIRQVTSDDFQGPPPRLMAPAKVVKVEELPEGGYAVTAQWLAPKKEGPLEYSVAALRAPVPDEVPGDADSTFVVHTAHRPFLCTGFQGSVVSAARHLFDFHDPRKTGCLAKGPRLTKNDESTKVPGVFLVGPQVQHDALSFCFIYKFRQRFAVVANAICTGLGKFTAGAVHECRKNNMYLDNFTTCYETCGENCTPGEDKFGNEATPHHHKHEHRNDEEMTLLEQCIDFKEINEQKQTEEREEQQLQEEEDFAALVDYYEKHTS